MIKKYYSVKVARSSLVIFLLFLMPSDAFSLYFKGLDLKIKTTVAEMYDDNITFDSDNKTEDYITTLGLGLGALYQGKRRSMEITGQLNHRFNARFNDIKNSSESVSLNFMNDFSEYDRMNLDYSFMHSHTPASFEEALERVTARRESFRHRVYLSYLRQISERFRIRAHYAYALQEFSEEFRNDQYHNTVGMTLFYSPGKEKSYSLTYSYSKNRFGNVINRIIAGMRRYATKSIYIDGKIGVIFSSSTSSFTLTNNDRSNIDSTISIINEIDEISNAKLNFSRSDEFSAERGDVSSFWRIEGQYNRRLLERLDGSLIIFYGENEFVDSAITNRLTGGSLSLMYEFMEDLVGNFYYVYSKLDSSEGLSGYSKNTIQISLTKIF